MNRCLRFYFLINVFLVSGYLSASGQYIPFQAKPEFKFVEGKAFVKIKKSVQADIGYSATNGYKDAYAKRVLHDFVLDFKIALIAKTFTRVKSEELAGIYTVTFDPAVSTELFCREIIRSGIFEYAEGIPLYEVEAVPDDVDPGQWHLQAINAYDAWDLFTGSGLIKIAVVDDAVLLNHEDLQASIWNNSGEVAGNSVDDDGNGYTDDINGYDVSDDDNGPSPPGTVTNAYFSHGTHVSGICAASTNNATGIASIGYNCKIIAVKTRPDIYSGSGVPDAYLGVEYAIAAGADIINMSWGGFTYSNTYQAIMNTAYNAGILLIGSAGNTGSTDYMYPSSYEHVISVGATMQSGEIANFSTRNGSVDVMAPGTQIYSTLAGTQSSYGLNSGTSMSAPIVSGICALMLSVEPSLSNELVEGCLENGCTPLNDPGNNYSGITGAGIVNAYNSLQCLSDAPHPGFHAEYEQVCPGENITMINTTSGLPVISYQWSFPGGTPSSSTAITPSVFYSQPGIYPVKLTACNSFGCDSILETHAVLVDYPSAAISYVSSLQFCNSTTVSVEVSFEGIPDFEFSYRLGSDTFTVSTSDPEHLLILAPDPADPTFELLSVSDVNCPGLATGELTFQPVFCAPCVNTDFEDGSFFTWDGYTGYCCGQNSFIQGFEANRHEITSGSASDAIINPISIVSPVGQTYSVKLGNSNVGSESEKIVKTFTVTEDNSLITYHYAVILQNPEGHQPEDKPKFEISFYDHNGVIIPGACGHYQVTAGVGTDDWEVVPGSFGDVILYKNWTLVGVDLTPYLGEQITLEFKTEDCGLGGHFGYAYVDVNCGPLAVIINGYCPGSQQVTLTAPGGFTGYVWEPSGDTAQSITIPTPSEGDSIWLYLTNEAGCNTSILHVFDELSFPDSIAVANDTLICSGQPFTLIASGAGISGSYDWESFPPGFSSESGQVTVFPDVTTTYCASAINQYGCGSSDTACATVSIVADTELDIGADTTLCAGDSMHFTVNGFQQYSWYVNGLYTSSGNSLSILPVAVTTTIVVKAGNQLCTARDTLVISLVYPRYYGADSIVAFCQGGDQVVLIAPPGNEGYLWSDNSSGEQLIVTLPQDGQEFSVVMISPEGCMDSLNYILDSGAFFYEADAGQDFVVCAGHPVNLQAAFAGPTANYTWQSIPPGYTANGRNATFFPTANTYFIVNVTSPLLCGGYNSDTVFVTILPTPLIDLGNDTTLCNADTLMINRSVPGYFNYWYSIPSGFHSEDSIVYLVPSQTTTYVLNLLNEYCTVSDILTVYIIPGTSEDEDVLFCPSGTEDLEISVPGNSSVAYWPSLDTLSHSVFIDPPYAISEIQAWATNAFGCTDTINFHLEAFSASLTVIPSNNVVCTGESVTLTAYGNVGQVVHWTSNPPLINLTGQSITVSPTASTTYTAAINYNNCNFNSSVLITVNNFPPFNLGADINICPGDTLTIAAPVSANEYSWYTLPSGFESGSSSVQFVPVQDMVLFLQAGDGACHATDQVSINLFTIPAINETQGADYCTGGDGITLTAPVGFTGYYWTPSGETVSSIHADVDTADEISIHLETAEGCKDTVTFHFFEKEFNVDAMAGPDIICNDQASNLFVTNLPGADFHWYSSEGTLLSESSAFTLNDVTSEYYFVTADSSGCHDADTVIIQVKNYPVVELGTDTFLCPGASITLDAGAGSEHYLWSDLTTGSTLTANATGSYSVNVNNWECYASDEIFIEALAEDSLFVPNVFTPGEGDGFNDNFRVIATNVDEYLFTIYNRFGDKIFQTTNPSGTWNGKVNEISAHAGTYFWVLKYKTLCSDGPVEKRGFLTLIR